MNDNNIPVPDPFAKDYEYLFPPPEWDKNEIIPISADYNILPYSQDIDVKIPQQ
ncbi:MAG: hypothetical protein K2J40_04440 [Ruminococcus sp.]|nr:hypothetical protein [Ruminococcus sp.]